jgi:hypothetical protein
MSTKSLKLKPETDLIAALIQYRESTKASGRRKLSAWANRKLAEVAGTSHVNQDVLLQDSIAVYHNTANGDERIFAVELLREFRSTLRDDELEALLDATK